MSNSPTGPVRPARLAGFILLGVAVVAVGLGIFALADSASGTSSASPTNSVTPPETFTPTTPRMTTTARPTTTTTTPAPTTSYPSGQTTTVIPAPPPNTKPQGPPPVEVRVYNNSRISDLAQCAATDLQNAGFDVVEVGNYSQGIVPDTTVYYTSLPGEQQTAEQIGQKFGMRVQPRFPGIADASPGVIVIVTKYSQFQC